MIGWGGRSTPESLLSTLGCEGIDRVVQVVRHVGPAGQGSEGSGLID